MLGSKYAKNAFAAGLGELTALPQAPIWIWGQEGREKRKGERRGGEGPLNCVFPVAFSPSTPLVIYIKTSACAEEYQTWTQWMTARTLIHSSMQSRWNLWRQGSVRRVSLGSNRDKHTRHSASSETVLRFDCDDVDDGFSVNLLVGRTRISSVFKPRRPTSPFSSAKSHRAWETIVQ